MSTHIDFLDVSVFYGDHKALDEVSLSIERNEIFGIVGPANSGKTTLLKAINRTIDLVTGTKVVGEVSIDVSDLQMVGLRMRAEGKFEIEVGGIGVYKEE